MFAPALLAGPPAVEDVEIEGRAGAQLDLAIRGPQTSASDIKLCIGSAMREPAPPSHLTDGLPLLSTLID